MGGPSLWSDRALSRGVTPLDQAPLVSAHSGDDRSAAFGVKHQDWSRFHLQAARGRPHPLISGRAKRLAP